MKKKAQPPKEVGKRKPTSPTKKNYEALSTEASDNLLKRKIADVSDSPTKFYRKKEPLPFRLNSHNDEGKSLTSPTTGTSLLLTFNEQVASSPTTFTGSLNTTVKGNPAAVANEEEKEVKGLKKARAGGSTLGGEMITEEDLDWLVTDDKLGGNDRGGKENEIIDRKDEAGWEELPACRGPRPPHGVVML